jgi:hypothetical protein
MSKKKKARHHQQPPLRQQFRPERRPLRKPVLIASALLLLSLAVTILAQWRATRLTASSNAMLSSAPVTAPSLAPGNPSKEYIYAGGKLVATEEPAVASNTAPSVQLTAPTSGFTTTAPTNITLTATATDSDGSVTKVEFFQGATKLGEDPSSPYSVTWNNAPAGSYSLTARATDNNGATTTSAAVNITLTAPTITTQSVAWTNPFKVNMSGNSLTKNGAANAWDAGASSTKAIASGNGYVEFRVGEANAYRMCGLSKGNDANQSYAEIDYAIYPSASGVLHIYENNIWRAQPGTYSNTDVFRVEIVDGFVKYKQNGTVIYTSTVAPTYPMRVDTALYSPGSTINNVVISGSLIDVAKPAENVVWTNPVKVNVSGNSLSRNAATNAWDGGASSTKAITSGDGFVQFTVGEANAYRMCGLSKGNDANQNYGELDYAIYPSASGVLHIYESSIWRAQPGTYAAGDVFRIEIVGGVVKYKQNGVVIYTSTVAPTYPLRVDTSLYTPGSTINNVVLCGTLTP